VNITWLPIAAVIGAATLVNARSDCPAVPTVTFVCVKLLLATGSFVSAAMRAVFVRMVPFATALLTLVMREKVAEAPAANEVATQETVPVAPTAGVVQLQPDGTVMDWNVVFAGTTEVKNSPAASLTPLLVTFWVKVSTPFATGRLVDAELVSERSAEEMMVGVVEVESLPRYVSPPPLVVAVLAGVSGADCVTVPVSAITG